MVRKQLYIDDDLDEALKSMSVRTGRSEADHVRTALRLYFEQERSHPHLAGLDPLLDLIGLVDDRGGPDDVALNHDHYLYSAPKMA
jgi:hypothetical protein